MAMGIGAQNDLGRHQNFVRKLTWKLPDKSIVFSVQIKVISQKKGFHTCWDGFFVQRSEYFSGQTCLNDMNLPKILMQSSPKFWLKIAQNVWNCSKFRHLTPTGGGPVPFGPPPPTPMEKATEQRTRPRAVLGAPRRAAWQLKSILRHSVSAALRTIIFYLFFYNYC